MGANATKHPVIESNVEEISYFECKTSSKKTNLKSKKECLETRCIRRLRSTDEISNNSDLTNINTTQNSKTNALAKEQQQTKKKSYPHKSNIHRRVSKVNMCSVILFTLI